MTTLRLPNLAKDLSAACLQLLLIPPLLLLLLAASVAFCAEESPPTADPKLEQIRIGVSLPLTGPLASFGTTIRDGIELALQDLKEAAKGSPERSAAAERIALVFEDNQYSGTGAVSSFQQLTNVHNINAFMVVGAPPALAVSPLVEAKRLPAIAFSASPTMDKLGYKFITRSWESVDGISAEAFRAVQFAKAKTVVVVSTQNESTLGLQQSFEEQIKGSRIKVILGEVILPGDLDFTTVATKIARIKPDIVFSNVLASQHMALIRKLRQQRIAVKIVANSAIFFDDFVRAPYPSELDGIMLAGPNISGLNDFFTRLNSMGKKASAAYMSALAYDISSAFYRELLALPSLNALSEFTFSPNLTGIMGSYTSSTAHVLSPPMQAGIFEGGKLKTLS